MSARAILAQRPVVDPLDGRRWRVDCGSALVLLPGIPDDSIQCSIGSPPYFRLRKYHTEPQLWGSWRGELGREAIADCLGWARGEMCDECFICHLRMIYAEVWRVLRPDGTLWINIGDSYSASGKGGNTIGNRNASIEASHRKAHKGFRPKNLMGIPWRLALALQADGWNLRQEIIWNKPATMPESVRDRCVKSHEHIFLFAKSERYYFDHKAIQETAKQTSIERLNRGVSDKHKLVDGAPGQTPHSISQPRSHRPTFGSKAKHKEYGTRIHSGKEWNPTMAGGAVGIAARKQKDASGQPYVMANKRSVWTVSNSGFKGDHYATYPLDLVEPMVLAGAGPDAIVLDPFSGMATTGIMALRLGRRYIGIELKPEYAAESRERIIDDAPLFNSV